MSREIHVWKIGDLVEARGQRCRVTRVHPFGTYDVETVDGARCYRITGLARFASAEKRPRPRKGAR